MYVYEVATGSYVDKHPLFCCKLGSNQGRDTGRKSGHTTPCRMSGRDCVKSLWSSYTGLYRVRNGCPQSGRRDSDRPADHSTHYTLHTSHYTLHTSHYTLHTAHCTMHFEYTLLT